MWRSFGFKHFKLYKVRLSLSFREIIRISDYKKMVKEEKKGKEEKKFKREMSTKFPKFPPWDHVDYHEQTVEFFATIKELPTRGLNPKFGINSEHVTTSNIDEVFGANCSNFMTSNPYLHIDAKKTLVKFHWQIYGLVVITNNEFMMWLVKGYITELKGHLMNWAIVVASTTREKVHRQEVKGLKNRSIDIFDFNYGELVGRVEGGGVCVTHIVKVKKEDVVGDDAKCPFGVSLQDVLLIDDLHLCLHELLMLMQVKMCCLESEKGEAQ
jgi:hypothetical protein